MQLYTFFLKLWTTCHIEKGRFIYLIREETLKIFGLVVLGLVQGLSEFLPISSSGHLLLFGKIFGIEDSIFVSIFLHVATLLSIVVVFRKDIWKMICSPFSKETMTLCIATIPTCIIVVLLLPIVKKSFGGEYLYISFLISAILLFMVSRYSKRRKGTGFTTKNALIMGVMQGFAVFPGISRSGATISAGILSGGDKEECAKFSFLMSLPIILLSMVGEIYDVCKGGQTFSVNIVGLILGFIVAFISGLLTIKFMMKLTKKANFAWFSVYLCVIAIISKFIMG